MASTAPTETSGSGGLEKSALTIGVVAVPDAAPIQIALDKGFFKEEGLDVKISVEVGGAAATPKLVAGQLDAMLGNYVALFLAQQAGAGKFKVVADSYQAAPDNFVIMTKGDNASINTAADLAGKKIAVNTLNAIGTLAVTATAKVAGVTINEKEQYVAMPLPEMGAALETGTVDAIWVAEPFISANAKAGAEKVADSMAGPLENFPIAGWVMTDKFTTREPQDGRRVPARPGQGADPRRHRPQGRGGGAARAHQDRRRHRGRHRAGHLLHLAERGPSPAGRRHADRVQDDPARVRREGADGADRRVVTTCRR